MSSNADLDDGDRASNALALASVSGGISSSGSVASDVVLEMIVESGRTNRCGRLSSRKKPAMKHAVTAAQTPNRNRRETARAGAFILKGSESKGRNCCKYSLNWPSFLN